MVPSINLSEVVYRENIKDEKEIAGESAKLMDNYIQRVRYQNAPAILVDEMVIVRNRFAELHDRLEWLEKYFPSQ